MECDFDFIFVVGDNESGKSTFAADLGAALNLIVGDTARLLDIPLARVLNTVAPFQTWKVPAIIDYILNHKAEYRAAKRAMGDELCALNPAWMIERFISAEARIIVGMRRASEIRAYLDTVPAGRKGMMFILYRPDAKGEIKPLSEFLAIPIKTEEICNNGDVSHLRATARRVAEDLCHS